MSVKCCFVLLLCLILQQNVFGQITVETVDLKVCVRSPDTCGVSSSNIDQLTEQATELLRNDTTYSRAVSYDSKFIFTSGNLEMATLGVCDGMGSKYLTDLTAALQSDLSTAANYVNNIYSTCKEIYDNEKNPQDGYYSIKKSDGTIKRVYCLMSADKCAGGGGWMRIGFFDTINADSSYRSCPDPLAAKSYAPQLNYSLCQRADDGTGCDSFYYDSYGLTFSKVCGYAKAYQYGSPDGFTGSDNINDNYLDGFSFTYGSPRTHIWSLACGVDPDGTTFYDCPCNSFNTKNPPSFVGKDYFCESGQGIDDEWWNPVELKPLDPLWDGEKCDSLEGNCCKKSSFSVPYFTKDLGVSTTEKIEIRACENEDLSNERVPIERLELYVQ